MRYANRWFACPAINLVLDTPGIHDHPAGMPDGNFPNTGGEYASQIDSRVILVDGTMLARLMIDHNVGVSPVRAFDVKKIDSDYFLEE